ncbi:DnaJ-class molecular chaperone with C-terminal Zn finger domain [uncultured Desulfatiglans sp.]|nr:DnaJ-class molecular chaperone with C-terminal Zn finger domain [uncultured Desulfatiglans sp.]
MKRYREITAAREVLGLPERATLKQIKTHYRMLLEKWHPDRSADDADERHEMTRRIIEAYRTIMDYCDHYRYSFEEDDIRKNLSPEDWLIERFGEPLWGDGPNKD